MKVNSEMNVAKTSPTLNIGNAEAKFLKFPIDTRKSVIIKRPIELSGMETTPWTKLAKGL